MPVSQADIDALTSAIANGERSVRFADGRMVEYHTPGDLIRARDYLVNLQAREAPASSRQPTAVRLYHGGRGFS
jgi:hypothetical protein